MKTTARIIFFVVFIFCVTGFASAQKPDPYKENIHKLLVVSNVQASSEVTISQMFDMFREQGKNVPNELWDLAEEKFQNQLMDMLVEIYSEIYKDYYSLKELKELIRFYESPLGKKMARDAPEIALRAGQAGQEWGYRIMLEILQEIDISSFLNSNEAEEPSETQNIEFITID